VNYHFDFAAILADGYPALLVRGVLFTLALTAVGAVFGIAIGVVGAACRAWRLKPFDHLFAAYVEAIRNTPFLVQLFFIFFGLPAIGVQLSDWQAASLAMIVNLGAYCTEIIRAGVQATPRGQIEAAQALAMTRAQIFRHVVMRPALQRVWPAIASQVVIVMLGSSVVSQIGAEELTFAANFIQGRNFRAFETYFVTTAIYLAMSVVLRRVLLEYGQRAIVGRPRVRR
jgi:His/Glu/Gln/Arg/opine family amino acid ABC transporter permease subunit